MPDSSPSASSSPVGIADFVTSTTHKTLRGPRGGFILGRAEHEKDRQFGDLPRPPRRAADARDSPPRRSRFKEALAPDFQRYQEQVLGNARIMAATLARRGLRIVSGGTDCHLFLVDLRPKAITGRDAEAALGRASITVNKNAIPHDPQKPFITKRHPHRLPAMTTRGFGAAEAEQVPI